jgi:PAS domain S-box-containing protein
MNVNETSSFFEHSPDVVLTLDPRGRISNLNPMGILVTGFPREEAIGSHLAELLVVEQQQHFLSWFARRLSGEASPLQELELITKAGDRLSLEINTTLLSSQGKTTGLLAVGRDITRRRHQEQSMAEELGLLRTLMDHLPEAIYIKDEEGNFILGNLALARQVGLPDPTALEGKNDFEIWPAELAEKLRMEEQWLKHAGQPMLEKEHSVAEAGGARQWFANTTVSLRNSAGRLVGFAGISRNVTERKNLELEREKLIRQLQDALGSVKTLTGLLPICAYCKKIRDDQGYWNQLEAYVALHSRANFSHGICPDCAVRLRQEINDYQKSGPPES